MYNEGLEMNMGIRKIIEAVDEAIFPSNIYCICCGALIDSSRPYALCDECIRKFHWNTGRTCDKCGKALPDTYRGSLCYDCMEHSRSFTRGYSCLTYGLHEREVLMDFKYNGKGYLGKKFGEILYDRISCEDLLIDVIVPVPVSAARLRKRGYNQSAVMARRLAQLMEVPCDEKLLVRTRNTKMLRTLDPAERALALDGAFAIAGAGRRTDDTLEAASAGKRTDGTLEIASAGKRTDGTLTAASAGRRTDDTGPTGHVETAIVADNASTGILQNKRVLLIDDILTTGATADACSKVLMEAGADSVIFLSLASGGNWKPEQEGES